MAVCCFVIDADCVAAVDANRSHNVGTSTHVEPVAKAVLTQLPSFVCTEIIQRYKGYIDGTAERRVDSLSANVSYELGTEQYTNVRRNGRRAKSILHLRGAWSQGEFGTLLAQSIGLIQSDHAILTRQELSSSEPMVVYSFFVSERESPWMLEVAGTRQALPFWTEIWTSLKTGVIVKVERRSQSVALDNGISEIRWSVTLTPMSMNRTTRLLPSMAEYEVAYGSDGRRERNEIRFTDYKRYGSQSSIHFGGMQ